VIPVPLDLSGHIPVPVVGNSPVLSFFDGAYGGAVSWEPSLQGGVFQPLTQYEARVVLTAAAGYAFPEGAVEVEHTGASTPPGDFSGVGATRTGTVVFPATGPAHNWYHGPFSGSSAPTTGDMDSAIDVIKAAKDQTALSLVLTTGWKTEAVDLNAGDIFGGLVLTKGVTSPANVVIDGGGRVIDLTGPDIDNYFPLITVMSGVTLTLRNITLQGMMANRGRALIYVSGGHLILETGAVITGNTTDGGNGGGVFVASGTFTMNGGTISGNRAINGGGVYVESGTFTMNGGTISGNTATGDYGNYNGGGGVNVNDGTFTMNGGTISNNQATRNGGGVLVWNPITKKGGTISGDNTAASGNAVYAYSNNEQNRWRNDTAGPGVNLTVTYDGAYNLITWVGLDQP
jgi:hypothetical protein